MEKIEFKGNALYQNFINNFLDFIVRPEIYFAGRNRNSYLFWQFIGITSGTFVIMTIAYFKNLSAVTMILVIVISILMSVLLFKSEEIFGKQYSLIVWAKGGVYHYQILIITSATIFLILSDEPALRYLDILVVGLILAQASGRIGCFMAGCCHGLPNDWGVLYTNEHLETGYRIYLRGVRLLPLQLIESLFLIVIFIICVLLTLKDNIPGEIFSFYIIIYGTGRFFIEFFRADTGRLYLLGFSEGQWTALILVSLIVGLELEGILYFSLWHLFSAILLITIIVYHNLKTYFFKSRSNEYFYPYHLEEIAKVLKWISGIAVMNLNPGPSGLYDGTTSQGLRISLDVLYNKNDRTYNYIISSEDKIMSNKTAKSLAKLIIRLLHPNNKNNTFELTSLNNSAYKILVKEMNSEIEY